MNKDQFYEKVHYYGRLTMGIAFILSFSLAAYLTFVLGHVPDMADIISGMIAIVGFVGVVWIVEPISYFPTLGSAGTYMSFLSGNIGNMRLPAITTAQDALGLEAGTDKAELAGIFALASSNIVNLLILAVVMVAGQVIVSSVPENILNSFNFALPGILGAMVVMIGSKLDKKYLATLIIIAVVVLQIIGNCDKFLPEAAAKIIKLSDTGIVAIVGIIFALQRAKADNK